MGKAAPQEPQGPHPAHLCRSELLLRLQGRILRLCSKNPPVGRASKPVRRSLGEGGPANAVLDGYETASSAYLHKSSSYHLEPVLVKMRTLAFSASLR